MTTAGDHVHTYPDSDELPHAPSGDIWFQESAYVTWWDATAGIGGVHRIGHEQLEGGTVSLWSSIFTADGMRHRRVHTSRLRPENKLPNGFGADPGHASIFENGKPRWVWQDDDCEGELTIHDFYPRMHNFPSSGNASTLTKEFAAQHFEAAGRITGSVTIGGKRHVVDDGLCYRDHSWGRRKWDTLLSHRWFTGTFGPQLSFGAMKWHSTDGSLGSFGLVVRNGVTHFARDVDILAYMEADGLTHRGGELTLTLGNGEKIRIDAKPIDGVVQVIHDIASVDQICTAEYNGQTGFCMFETTNNPRAGSGPVLLAIQAVMENGLSRRPADIPRR